MLMLRALPCSLLQFVPQPVRLSGGGAERGGPGSASGLCPTPEAQGPPRLPHEGARPGYMAPHPGRGLPQGPGQWRLPHPEPAPMPPDPEVLQTPLGDCSTDHRRGRRQPLLWVSTRPRDQDQKPGRTSQPRGRRRTDASEAHSRGRLPTQGQPRALPGPAVTAGPGTGKPPTIKSSCLHFYF